MPSTRKKSLNAEDGRGHVWRLAAVVWTCLLVSSWHCPAGAQSDGNISSTSINPSPAVSSAANTVSLSPSSQSLSSSSSPPSPTSSPTPPPPPTKPFLNYTLIGELHLMIQTLNICIYTGEKGYYNLTEDDYPALQSQPSAGFANKSINDNQLNFTKQYFYNKTGQSNSSFVFSFILKLEPSSTDQMWYISSFTHRNRTDDSNICSFTYSGMSAVHAPSDLTYFCSDIEFKGDCVDSNIKSKVQFGGLFIQAFQIPSSKSTYIDCGAKDHNNSIIDVVVGSVVGATIGIALIVIVATLVTRAIARKVRWRGYNLLDD